MTTMEKYWNTWQDMGAWLRTKTRGEAESTSVTGCVCGVCDWKGQPWWYPKEGTSMLVPLWYTLNAPRRQWWPSPACPFTMHPLSLNPKESSFSFCFSCAIIDYRFAAWPPALQLHSTMREGSSNTMSRNPEEQPVFVTLSNTDSFNTPQRSLPWGFIFVQQQAPSQLAEEMTWLVCSQQRSLHAAQLQQHHEMAQPGQGACMHSRKKPPPT